MADAPELTPIAPEEGGSIPPKTTPFAADQIAAAVPPATAAAPAAKTIHLKPVIRRPTIHKPVVGGARPPAAPAAAPAPAAPAAKSSTQNLKSVTGPIPAQAVLRKTGIIAEGIITPAQQQAAKSKTSRISLESAIGVAPVKETAAAPLKTIKLRRPTDIKPPPFKPIAPAAPAVVAEPPPVAPLDDVPPAAPAEAVAPEATTTQKRTLRLHRPTMGGGRPAMGPAPAAPAADGGVADISDIPDIPGMPMESVSASAKSAGVPSWCAAMSFVASIAVLFALGGLLYFLWSDGNAPDGAGTDPNSPYVVSL